MTEESNCCVSVSRALFSPLAYSITKVSVGCTENIKYSNWIQRISHLATICLLIGGSYHLYQYYTPTLQSWFRSTHQATWILTRIGVAYAVGVLVYSVFKTVSPYNLRPAEAPPSPLYFPEGVPLV